MVPASFDTPVSPACPDRGGLRRGVLQSNEAANNSSAFNRPPLHPSFCSIVPTVNVTGHFIPRLTTPRIYGGDAPEGGPSIDAACTTAVFIVTRLGRVIARGPYAFLLSVVLCVVVISRRRWSPRPRYRDNLLPGISYALIRAACAVGDHKSLVDRIEPAGPRLLRDQSVMKPNLRHADLITRPSVTSTLLSSISNTYARANDRPIAPSCSMRWKVIRR